MVQNERMEMENNNYLKDTSDNIITMVLMIFISFFVIILNIKKLVIHTLKIYYLKK